MKERKNERIKEINKKERKINEWNKEKQKKRKKNKAKKENKKIKERHKNSPRFSRHYFKLNLIVNALGALRLLRAKLP